MLILCSFYDNPLLVPSPTFFPFHNIALKYAYPNTFARSKISIQWIIYEWVLCFSAFVTLKYTSMRFYIIDTIGNHTLNNFVNKIK